jgi:chitinase
MNLASLSGASVMVRFTNNAGNDSVSVVGANYGTIACAGGNFVGANRDFTSSAVVQVGAVVTITLGTASGAMNTDTASTLTWTPSASATDLAGNAMSTTARAEVGGTDTDF